MRKMIALCFAAILSLSLLGCSGGSDTSASNMAGTYKIESVKNGESEYTAETIDTLGLSGLVTMEIADDNTGSLNAFGTVFDIAIDPDNSNVTITADGSSETVDCAIEGDHLTFAMDGKSLTLAKQE